MAEFLLSAAVQQGGFCCVAEANTAREEQMINEHGTDGANVESKLAECEDEVDHLKRENRLLRDASRTFGALAERLNATLESERRGGGDRRARARGVEDRRQSSLAGEPSRR